MNKAVEQDAAMAPDEEGRCWLPALRPGCGSARGMRARRGCLLSDSVTKYFGGYLQIPAGTASCKQI